MIDYQRNWFAELDGALPARVRCANCDFRVVESDLSLDGLCTICASRADDDDRELRAEAMRRP